MMSDDDKPAKIPQHIVGQDLAVLSVDELKSRIMLLKDEIARLERAVAEKDQVRSAAESLFKL